MGGDRAAHLYYHQMGGKERGRGPASAAGESSELAAPSDMRADVDISELGED